jgi:Flp pilus assembly pilin Flp
MQIIIFLKPVTSTKMGLMLQRLIADRKGATAIEYGLITGLIALAIASTLRTLGVLVYINFSQVFIALSSVIDSQYNIH